MVENNALIVSVEDAIWYLELLFSAETRKRHAFLKKLFNAGAPAFVFESRMLRFIAREAAASPLDQTKWVELMLGPAVIRYMFIGCAGEEDDDDAEWTRDQVNKLARMLPREVIARHRWCTAMAAGRDIWAEPNTIGLCGDDAAAYEWTLEHLGRWLIACSLR